MLHYSNWAVYVNNSGYSNNQTVTMRIFMRIGGVHHSCTVYGFLGQFGTHLSSRNIKLACLYVTPCRGSGAMERCQYISGKAANDIKTLAYRHSVIRQVQESCAIARKREMPQLRSNWPLTYIFNADRQGLAFHAVNCL